MNNLLERFIKRNNKKRGINITVATIVMFLLSCTGIYAATVIDKNEKEYILHVGENGDNSYRWGGSKYLYTIDQNKLIINGRLEAGNNTQSLEISSNAKDITVENNGFIDGVTIGRDYSKLDGTNATFTNNGIVSNEGNAIVVYSKNATVNNYGIIKGGEKGVEFTTGISNEKLNNQGIILDKDGKILNASTVEQKIVLDNGNYTVKNAVDSSGKAQAITMNGTSGSNSFTNYILNGIDTTISVSGKGNNLSGSVVNSLGNAINIESGAELGLGSTTVNGNIAINGGTLILIDINNKINGNVSGTTDNDTIKLGYQVDTNINYTNLNTILKGSGVDTLKFHDNGNTIDTTQISFAGKFEGGAGADTFIVNGANYTIDGGAGTDTLKLTKGYTGAVSDFSGVTNIETLQLGDGSNTLDISNINGKFTTIKGGEFVNGGSGKNTIKTSTDIGETLTLVGGKDSSVKNILVLDNSNNKIEFNGKLDTSGGNWNIQVNNLKGTNSVTLNKENLNGKATSLELLTNISGETETKNLVDLLNASGITYAIPLNNNTSNYKDNLVFNGTTLNNKTIFAINYNDSVTMQKNITGQYAFKPLGTFTPTVKVDSFTTFEQNSKVTSVDYNGKESGVNFQVTSGALSLGSLKYENGKLVYSGANPFVDGYKYTINGNVNLNFEGLENAGLTSGKSIALGNVNNNITITGGSLSMPSFLKYSNGAFVVKSWDEMNPYGNNNNFLETTYNNMLSKYGQTGSEAITGALNTWSKEALVNYISTGGITQYDFTLDGKTYQNTLLTGDNSDISKEFKITGNSGTITFQNIATSDSLTLATTGGTVNLTDGVNIGGDINFGESSNVNLNVNAYYAGGVASTIKNIKGNDNDSNISLTHVNIIGNNSNDGKIELGAGNDTLTLKNVGVNSITGSGKNTIELNQGSNVGTISLSKDSTSAISLMSLDVDSSIDNNITVNDGATVGTIDLSSAGNSLVTLNSGKITNVKFGSGNDMLTYNGGNISKIDFGAGDNVLNVRADLDLSNTKISVAEGGTVRNTLNVGKISVRSTTVKDYLTLSGDFSAFSNINIEGATKLESSSKLAEGTNINLGSNTLIAGINIENGTAKTVLSGANLEAGENSKLIIDTMKADSNTTISLDGITGIENVSKVDTNTIAHIIKENADGTYSVEANKNLISGEGNDLVNGIISSDNGEGLFGDITDKEAQAQLLTDVTKDMMYSSPYAYSSIVSRKTAEMINNAVMNFDLKADKNQWLAYGSLLGSGKEIQDYYSGVNNTTSNINTDIYGAYVQAEYGYTDNTALGFVVGANKSDSDIAKSSLDGKGMYLGGYVKHNYSDNLQIIGGLAYQYNSYESDRVAGNSNKTLTYSEKYNDDTITGFVGGKYEYKLSETLTLQPNAKLNITHIMQDGVTESNKEASLKANSKNFTNIGTEIGADLVKTINVQNGKVNLKVGTSLTYLITGADKETMRANLISDNTKFDIKTPEQDKTNVKFKVGAQYEKESGVLYNVEGSYITSSKEKEWVVGAGIGYRF
ncbi:MAG: autotransporter domain-containing protein [Candidatus Fusobacterium pullicola]|uniref:Autotransporter domain-containing protein n=1 Tax=Candidatus Fusobacterium pullicola TaxID=2838601 RepID=A0A9E2NWA0_9FUSO|nr:autotransporter domain-containing protein [Candidatus Fusobacterium pullicola]